MCSYQVLQRSIFSIMTAPSRAAMRGRLVSSPSRVFFTSTRGSKFSQCPRVHVTLRSFLRHLPVTMFFSLQVVRASRGREVTTACSARLPRTPMYTFYAKLGAPSRCRSEPPKMPFAGEQREMSAKYHRDIKAMSLGHEALFLCRNRVILRGSLRFIWNSSFHVKCCFCHNI